MATVTTLQMIFFFLKILKYPDPGVRVRVRCGAGCGVREQVRVRFTCGQDFARTSEWEYFLWVEPEI